MPEDYQSIVARTIIIPELDIGLSITTAEHSSNLREGHGTEGDELLGRQVQDLFGVSYVNVLTYDRWVEIADCIETVINRPEFEQQMLQAYGGPNRQRDLNLRIG